MKTITILFLCLIMGTFVFSQTTEANYPVPEYINVPMYYDPTTKELSTLERQTASHSTRPTSPISYESVYYIDRMKSPIRFSAASKPEIIVKISNPDIDPSTQVQMNVFKVNPHPKRERREFVNASSAVYAGSKVNNETLPINFKRVASGVYIIKYQFGPGEYFIGIKGNSYLYAFGID